MGCRGGGGGRSIKSDREVLHSSTGNQGQGRYWMFAWCNSLLDAIKHQITNAACQKTIAFIMK